MKGISKFRIIIALILSAFLCVGAASDYKVKSDGTIYGYDFITKGPWIDSRAYPTLAAADAAAYNAGKLLVISQNYALTANTVLTASVMRIAGGSFTKASTFTLTINGKFQNPDNGQCFIGFATGVTFGAGAVKEAKLEWWGGDNTGATDNAAIFGSAVSAFATKGKIHIDKQSTFKVNSTTAIGTKDITVYGGGTIKLGADVYAFSVAGGNLEIEGMNFTTATSETGSVATALSASTGRFENNTVTNLKGGFHNYWNNSVFKNNTISILPAGPTGGYAIHLPGSGNKVLNNRITGGRHHIYISGGPPTVTDPVENNLVDGNTCTSAGYGAIAVYAFSTQGAVQYNRVTNNIIVDTVSGPAIDVNTNAVNNVISGNTIHGFVAGHGISIEGVALTAAGKRPYNNTISNNTIISKVVDEVTYRNIRLLNAYNNVISGNTLIHPLTTTAANVIGINLDSQTTPNAYRNRVIGNSFTMCRLNNATIDDTEISGNTFYTAPLQQPIAIDASGTADVGFNNLGGVGAFAIFVVGDTTPSVANGTRFKTANTGDTFITTLDNGYLGQVVTIWFNDANTTLGDLTQAGDGLFRLSGAVNFVGTLYDTITLIKTGGTEWQEVSRSVN